MSKRRSTKNRDFTAPKSTAEGVAKFGTSPLVVQGPMQSLHPYVISIDCNGKYTSKELSSAVAKSHIATQLMTKPNHCMNVKRTNKKPGQECEHSSARRCRDPCLTQICVTVECSRPPMVSSCPITRHSPVP